MNTTCGEDENSSVNLTGIVTSAIDPSGEVIIGKLTSPIEIVSSGLKSYPGCSTNTSLIVPITFVPIPAVISVPTPTVFKQYPYPVRIKTTRSITPSLIKGLANAPFPFPVLSITVKPVVSS